MSRLIKSCWASQDSTDKKVISIRSIVQDYVEEEFILEPVYEKSMDEIVAEAKVEAKAIIRQAIDEAEGLKQEMSHEKQQWEQEKPQLIMVAEQAGFEQGLIQGRDQGILEYQELIQTAHEVVVASKNEYQKQIELANETILKIAITVAEKIVSQKLADQEQFLPIVKSAIKEAKDYREVQLHIHPSHYGFLLSQKDELMGLFPRETDFYLYPDDSLNEWSCIIESANGRIDASIDSQLNEIKRKLLEIMESE